MKPIIFCFFSLVLLTGCKKREEAGKQGLVTVSRNVSYKQAGGHFTLHSGKFNYEFPTRALPLRRIILLNDGLVGYFTALGAEGSIVGVASPQYIFSDKIRSAVAAGKIQNIGNEQKFDVEQILALKPDAVFGNYVPSFENTYSLLRKNGIRVVFFDEYEEQFPLDKAKYLLVFGRLLGKEVLAEDVYRGIEKNYNNYKNIAAKTVSPPVVLADEMYGAQWFLAGGQSNLANFIKDAGGRYILEGNSSTGSVPMAFEEVLVKSATATVWVNAGNHKTRAEMLQINPNYNKIPAFRTGRVYAMTAREKDHANDYFEGGTVRADLVLKDYIKIFHPEAFPKDSLAYAKKLK